MLKYFEDCLEKLNDGKELVVVFDSVWGDWCYLGIKDGYCYMVDDRFEKCKVEDMKEFFEYLSKEDGFEEVEKIEVVDRKDFLDGLDFWGEEEFKDFKNSKFYKK